MDPNLLLIILVALVLLTALLELIKRLWQGVPLPALQAREVDPLTPGTQTHAPPPIPLARPGPDAPPARLARPVPLGESAKPSAPHRRRRGHILAERGPASLREARRGIILLTVLGPCRAQEPRHPGAGSGSNPAICIPNTAMPPSDRHATQ